ncbi:NUDIX hydrolase [Bacillus spongiae]|uniref:NUDIX hydrolase n=1 Tax=Bacillus spongiae TaxID=2683610 RepID=A0ABU8HFX1_9BACI
MKEWFGSAAVCMNEKNELLMVRSIGSEAWAVPSGGIEVGETAEECCKREVKEETGYEVEIINRLFIKETEIKGIQVKTFYFKVRKMSRIHGIMDPDDTIIAAEWKTLCDVQKINHAYPEDKEFLINLMQNATSSLIY